MQPNILYYGDNLDIMREHIADESVNLIYLDPPFNSQQAFNVFFHSPKENQSQAQFTAFEDTWHWGDEANREYDQITHVPNTDAAQMIQALRSLLGEINLMAYLVMMTSRLIELHRVLKPTGTLYLHCDPTASHYLKVVMDGIFGVKNFQNEISWKRTTTKSDYRQGATNYPRVRDILLVYRKDIRAKGVFHQPFTPYTEAYKDAVYRHKDSDGRAYTLDKLTAPGSGKRGHPLYELLGVTRYWVYGMEKMQRLLEEGRIIQTAPGRVPRYKRYLDEVQGVAIGDSWDDILAIQGQSKEFLGYPTQKPLTLLERIIQTSSNEGDTVLDPFCGCGTAIHAAQRLNRHWIGIDITHLAIALIEKRMRDAFPEIQYLVEGVPEDLAGARDLASRDKYQFQYWACTLVNAQPYKGKVKGADQGIDGLIFFADLVGGKQKTQKIVVSVKGGEHVGVTMVRDLITVMKQNDAVMGLFVTLIPPTEPMNTAAAKEGLYWAANGQSFPRVQILTIEGLLSGTEQPQYFDYQHRTHQFRKMRTKEKFADQHRLFG